ncbi:MAG: metallophosphoesterase [Sedimentisphaerales bacterium]|nr:metallophosphoesterase [Sedimentisphaerales bacterium]
MKHRHIVSAIVFAVVLAGLSVPVSANVEKIGAKPLWSTAFVADTQSSEREYMLALFNKLQDEEPDMVIHLGDTHFEWSSAFTIRALSCLLRSKPGGLEFHLAPGNHDMRSGLIKSHLRRAATEGLYRSDKGITFKGEEYALARVAAFVPNPVIPIWNSDIVDHPAWQPKMTARRLKKEAPDVEGSRYVFKRGGIRFVVCDWNYSKNQAEWIREVITTPDDSSVTILLHHYHKVSTLAKYFKGIEGKHNVKLVLSGHDHRYNYEVRDGITYITQSGIARSSRDCDTFLLNVYNDHLRIDRYLIPKKTAYPAILGPEPIWMCPGKFTEYKKPLTAASSQYVRDPAEQAIDNIKGK